VLQELNHAQGTPGRAPCPYVVGSGLFMESWELTEYSCLETSQTQLDHQFWELDDERYYVVWDLLEEFFPPGLIDAMWEAYLGLVVRLAREPAAWEAWQLLSLPAPQCRRRDEANATEATESTEAATPARLLNDLLARAAADYPDHDALVTPQRRLSYRELDGFANRIGRRLRAHGAMPGQLVAVVMEKGWEQVAAVAGILAAGAAYVPIDPGLPRQRLQYLLDNAQARIVLTQRHLDRAVDWPPTGLRLVVADDEFGDVDGSPLAPAQGSEDLAYVIYTSGSTGEPKGVMIDHRAALNTVIDINARGGVGPRDRLFGVSSLSFDLSVYDIFGAFAAGAALVLPSATRDPAHWRDLMASERVTVWNSAPALMQLLLDSGSGSAAFSALRLVMLSGDWIPVALPQRIQAQAPAAQVLGLGGATEASIWSIAYPIDRVDPDWQSVPYGKPLANQRWHVLDEAMLPCPDWVAGELCIAGAGLARGYWRDPEKTARGFIHHPVSGEPLYRTGDTGRYLPDGNIEFLGRRDFQVKIQGYRIELGEIEAALARHPQVSESVVVAPPDGRGGRQLLAYVVPAPTSSEAPRAEELQGFLGQCLPEYMIPGTFIFLPALPLTSNGKVDRKALPAPQRQRRTDPRPTRAPSERFEAELVEIWRELLGVDSLGVHDDFFELGGQSFTAIRMLLRVTQRCGRSLGLGAVLEERTIEGLARRLRAQEAPGAWSPLVSLHAAEGTPWFLVHPAGGSVTGYRALAPLLAVPLYGLQAAGLHGEATAVDDAPRMAGAYVEALRAVQPSGPYTLGGWSSGGAIAFEMARQLEASGERVARVVLIDSPAPLQHEAVAEATLLRWFFEDLDIGFPVERLAGATLEDVAPEKLLATALHYAPVAAGLGVEELAPIWSVFKATIRAGRAYRAQAIEAPLWVLRAEDRVVSEFADHPADADAAWGWGRYTSGPVATASLPGNHHTLLRAPNVHRLAATLHRLAAETPAGSAAQKQMKATPQG
jgi:amino acid adenylation domain-containing protein